MTTINPIKATNDFQQCYEVFVRFQGKRKRARKFEIHMLRIGENYSPEDILESKGQIKPEVLTHFKSKAEKLIDENYKECSNEYRLLFLAKKIRRDGSFYITEQEPFSDDHIRLTVIK
jgi:hypothetical protein